ncbi:hypothetical protein QFZ71_004888 [Streptomyces sp. V2I9]|nr:hypothetical protein [Streptomyces sp. V2I9]
MGGDGSLDIEEPKGGDESAEGTDADAWISGLVCAR